MFITSNGSASFRHPSIAPHKQKHWTVVTRALEGPWYLVVYDVTCRKGRRVSQTSLVACDEALLDLLAEISVADLRGIGRLDRHQRSGQGWDLKWIDALWKPVIAEARKVGALLLRFQSEPLVRDARLRPVEELLGRRLLYSAAGFVVRGHEGTADGCGCRVAMPDTFNSPDGHAVLPTMRPG